MELGTGPRRDVFAAADVRYLGSGSVRAAIMATGDAVLSAVVAESTAIVPEVISYRPGGSIWIRRPGPARPGRARCTAEPLGSVRALLERGAGRRVGDRLPLKHVTRRVGAEHRGRFAGGQ